MNRMALLRPEAAAAAWEDPGMYLAPSAWRGGCLGIGKSGTWGFCPAEEDTQGQYPGSAHSLTDRFMTKLYSFQA